MKLTKIQKALKNIGAEFTYEENFHEETAVITFKDGAGKEYEVKYTYVDWRETPAVMFDGEEQSNQAEVSKWIESHSDLIVNYEKYQRGQEARKKERAEYEFQKETIDVKKYQSGMYELRIRKERNGNQYYRIEKGIQGNTDYYAPDLTVDEYYQGKGKMSEPEIRISNSGGGYMTIEDTEHYVKKLNDAIVSAKYFTEMIRNYK